MLRIGGRWRNGFEMGRWSGSSDRVAIVESWVRRACARRRLGLMGPLVMLGGFSGWRRAAKLRKGSGITGLEGNCTMNG